jgi:hypothetical protein
VDLRSNRYATFTNPIGGHPDSRKGAAFDRIGFVSYLGDFGALGSNSHFYTFRLPSPRCFNVQGIRPG